ncbi:MAG: DUF134 domain-containing protein [bacterium]|nr:DUF134 domain-containing protein [bacterium]
MPRPKRCRFVTSTPGITYFKPRGVPLRTLEVVEVSLDEFEAIRLADLEACYHEEAADKMGVSRQTFGRIIESGRKKIADALINGKALSITGGHIEMATGRTFVCADCAHSWEEPYGTGRPQACPACKSSNVSRADGRCHGGGRGNGMGRGRRHMGKTS